MERRPASLPLVRHRLWVGGPPSDRRDGVTRTPGREVRAGFGSLDHRSKVVQPSTVPSRFAGRARSRRAHPVGQLNGNLLGRKEIHVHGVIRAVIERFPGVQEAL